MFFWVPACGNHIFTNIGKVLARRYRNTSGALETSPTRLVPGLPVIHMHLSGDWLRLKSDRWRTSARPGGDPAGHHWQC